jgi:proteasome lid subunit RPN8/RPN11
VIWLTKKQRTAIRKLACKNPTEETCGFVLTDGSVIQVNNVADDRHTTFSINPQDYAKYDDQITGIWHTHLELAGFSPLDQQVLMTDTLPWAVYCLADNSFHECDFTTVAPFLGRPFIFGLYDCYSLISDKLHEMEVELPPWPRGTWGEWDTPGFNPFDMAWPEIGEPVYNGKYQEGDILLLNLGNHPGHTDHVGVFLDRRTFLHHPAQHKSRKQLFGSYWERRLNWVIRPGPLWSKSAPSNS